MLALCLQNGFQYSLQDVRSNLDNLSLFLLRILVLSKNIVDLKEHVDAPVTLFKFKYY